MIRITGGGVRAVLTGSGAQEGCAPRFIQRFLSPPLIITAGTGTKGKNYEL